MARPLESSIERRACERVLAEYGVANTKLVKATGYPDRLFWVPGGRPLLIEFKRLNEAPRKYQKYIHANLRELGYDVEVHDTIEGAVEAVRRALEAARVSEKSSKVHDRARVRRTLP